MLKISTILTIYQMAIDAIKELKHPHRMAASQHQTLIEALVDVRDISARLGGQLAWQQALKGSSAPAPASEPDPLPQPDVKLAPGETQRALLRLAQLALPEPAPASKRATIDGWLDAGSKAALKRKHGDPSTKAILAAVKAYASQPKGVVVGDAIEMTISSMAKHIGCSRSQVHRINSWLKGAGLIRPVKSDGGSTWVLTLPAPGGSSSLARPEWLAAALKSLAGRKTGEADPNALKGVIRACARLAKWQGDALIIKAPASAFAKEADTTASTALRCIYWLRAKGLATTKQAPTKQKPIEMTLTMPGGAQ